jgi:hypothetical protein
LFQRDALLLLLCNARTAKLLRSSHTRAVPAVRRIIAEFAPRYRRAAVDVFAELPFGTSDL